MNGSIMYIFSRSLLFHDSIPSITLELLFLHCYLVCVFSVYNDAAVNIHRHIALTS